MERPLAYKYRLRPTQEQAIDLHRRCVIARKCWNFILGEWNKLDKKMPISEKHKTIRNQYGVYLRQLLAEGNDWQVVSNKRYYDYIKKAFDASWKRFFDALKNGELNRARAEYRQNYKTVVDAQIKQGVPKNNLKKFNKKRFDNLFKPKFKGRGSGQSFTTDSKGSAYVVLERGLFYIDAKSAPIKFTIHKNDKLLGAQIAKDSKLTVTETSDGAFFLSISVSIEVLEPKPVETPKNIIGFDTGVSNFLTDNNGNRYNIRDASRMKNKVDELKRKKSKAIEVNKKAGRKGKKNILKLMRKIAKKERQIAQMERHDIHLFTSKTIEHFDVVAVEGWDAKDFSKKNAPIVAPDGKTFARNGRTKQKETNRRLMGNKPFEVKRQLKYKAEWSGKIAHVTPRFAPTNIRCSNCGQNYDETEPLASNEWTCPYCGTVHDRRQNSAINVLKLTSAELKLNLAKMDTSPNIDYLRDIATCGFEV